LCDLVKDVFKIFDKDGNKTIDRSEATKHWSQVRFGKISANEFFNTVDFNHDGEISEDEFIEFWQIVKGSGHTEEEIREEVRIRIFEGLSKMLNQLIIVNKNQERGAVGRF
jgi:Ca2+-binding EF-hand superfamily protein